MARTTTSYFQIEIQAPNFFNLHAGDVETTFEKIKEHGIKFSKRSLYSLKKNKTKNFSINNKTISITKI